MIGAKEVGRLKYIIELLKRLERENVSDAYGCWGVTALSHCRGAC